MSAASKAAARAARSQSVAESYQLLAPVGGLNYRDALANMPETDATVLDNFFCQQGWVEMRGGSTRLATFTGTCQTLLPYSGIATSGNRLFAAVSATNNGIYRVDNAGGGAVGAAVVGGSGSTIQAITNPYYDYEQFGTGAANVLYLVNGSDPPLLFDGTTWYAISTSSTPYALTGGPTPLSSLQQVAVYKNRLWFVQANSMNVYYLPQSQFAGALTLLNLAPLFKLGGSIAAVVTVSMDNSDGTNDYIMFVSNQGEAVMYQGYDPSIFTTFSETAHFRIGAPIGIGRQCWQKMGMDALILCRDGPVMVSDALLTDRSQIVQKYSDKIRFGVLQQIQNFGSLQGWEVLVYPAGNKLILNVPQSSTTSFQYVMNTLSGAWSTWGNQQTPVNAQCWENYNNLLYYGTTGSVQLGDVGGGAGDNGVVIVGTVAQAPSYLGERTQLKRVTQGQPIMNANGTTTELYFGVAIDFYQGGINIPGPMSIGGPSFAQEQLPWLGLAGEGYAFALNMETSMSTPTALQWHATNVMFEPCGKFYGK